MDQTRTEVPEDYPTSQAAGHNSPANARVTERNRRARDDMAEENKTAANGLAQSIDGLHRGGG